VKSNGRASWQGETKNVKHLFHSVAYVLVLTDNEFTTFFKKVALKRFPLAHIEHLGHMVQGMSSLSKIKMSALTNGACVVT